MNDEAPATLYAIYDHPSDYPEGFVVRQWLVSADQIQPGDAQREPTLTEAHATLPAEAKKVDWPGEPDPTIIEVWM